MLGLSKSWGQRVGGGGDDETEIGEGGGTPIACLEPYIPIEVNHSIYQDNNLPCLSQPTAPIGGEQMLPTTNWYNISIQKLTPSSTYTLAVFIGAIFESITSTSTHQTFRVRFLNSGWNSFTIIPTTIGSCEMPKLIAVPVFCDCPQQPYKVLGRPFEDITYHSVKELQETNYVIGTINFVAKANDVLRISGKSFQILGKTNYHTDKPYGNIYDSKIRLIVDRSQPIDDNDKPGIVINDTIINGGAIRSFFQGQQCFGMWEGFEVVDSIPINSSLNEPAILIKNSRIMQAETGIQTRVGSRGALGLENLEINACRYGIITGRDALYYAWNIEINKPNGVWFPLKPYDVSAHNLSFENQSLGLVSRFNTEIGFWRTSPRATSLLQTPQPPPAIINKINRCIIGYKLDVFQYNTTLSATFVPERFLFEGFSFAGIYLNTNLNVEVVGSQFLINADYLDGNITFQEIALLNSLRFIPEVLPINPTGSFPHIRRISCVYAPLKMENFSFRGNIISESVPPFSNNYQFFGVVAKNINFVRGNRFLFNMIGTNLGNLNSQSSASNSELKATAVWVDSSDNNIGNDPNNIRDNYFRNVFTGIRFNQGLTPITAFRCNYFQNTRNGLSFEGSSQLFSNLGDLTTPCGNKFTWASNLFSGGFKIVNHPNTVIPNSITNTPFYYRYNNEVYLPGVSDVIIQSNFGNGYPQNVQPPNIPTCPTAMRDTFKVGLLGEITLPFFVNSLQSK